MSLSDLTREFFRQLQEMSQFKLNLLFANLSIVIMVSGYLDYFTGHQSVEAQLSELKTIMPQVDLQSAR